MWRGPLRRRCTLRAGVPVSAVLMPQFLLLCNCFKDFLRQKLCFWIWHTLHDVPGQGFLMVKVHLGCAQSTIWWLPKLCWAACLCLHQLPCHASQVAVLFAKRCRGKFCILLTKTIHFSPWRLAEYTSTCSWMRNHRNAFMHEKCDLPSIHENSRWRKKKGPSQFKLKAENKLKSHTQGVY